MKNVYFLSSYNLRIFEMSVEPLKGFHTFQLVEEDDQVVLLPGEEVWGFASYTREPLEKLGRILEANGLKYQSNNMELCELYARERTNFLK